MDSWSDDVHQVIELAAFLLCIAALAGWRKASDESRGECDDRRIERGAGIRHP